MKKIIFYSLISLSVIVLLYLAIFCNSGERIKRIKFSINEGAQIPIDSVKDIEIKNIITEDIPDAQVYKFLKKIVLSLTPQVTGKYGLFFTLNVKSDCEKRVKTKIVLHRKGVGLTLKRYFKNSYYQSFSKEMDFRKGDRIDVEVSGSGMIALNTPVLYRIIERSERKYVFVIALDTLRADRIGKFRNGVMLTPNISKLKKNCVNFPNTFAQSNWTLASFMSFFTSLYEFNHRATKESGLNSKIKILTEGLSRKFFTFNLNSGLWMSGKYGFSRGFDFFNVYSLPKDNLGGKKLFKKSIDFLNNTNIPSLFMFLHTYQIHSPYNPPKKFLVKINKKPKYRNLDTYFYNKQFKNDISSDERMAMEELYDTEILAFDTYFGEFISFLKRKKIYKNSMIIFVSDHGEEFFEHKGWSHGHSMFNDVIRVPFMIKFPGNRFQGKTVELNVGLIDILPTIYDYFEMKVGTVIDGISLLPVINGKIPERELLFSSTTTTKLVKDIPPKFAILDGNFKLIYNFKYSKKNIEFFSKFGNPPEESKISVFNIKSDEKELTPLRGNIYNKLFGKYIGTIDKLKKIININKSLKSGKKLILTEEEKKKLESLGYFQK